ncbi:MAG: hypothetical protein ACH350_10030 [Parachlamydiaceae bacterium]
MSLIINKITIELYQEADNNVGSEHAEIIVNPVLIGLWQKGKVDHYFTFKSEDGFSFNDKEEVLSIFTKVEKIVNEAK